MSKKKIEYPIITVGICTRNNAKTIEKLLFALKNAEYPMEKIEVLIVDGLSSDGTIKIIEDNLRNSGLKYSVLSDGGRGMGYARKLVCEHAFGEFVIFLDADQYFQPPLLVSAVETLSRNRDVAAIVYKTRFTNSPSLISRLESYKNYGNQIVEPQEDSELDVWNFSTGGCVMRKEAVISVGNFDPAFVSVAEDTDCGFRLKKAGWKLMSSKEAFIYHTERSSCKSLFKQYYNYGFGSASVGRKYGQFFKSKPSLLVSTVMWSVSSFQEFFMLFRATHSLETLLYPVVYISTKISFFIGYLGH